MVQKNYNSQPKIQIGIKFRCKLKTLYNNAFVISLKKDYQLMKLTIILILKHEIFFILSIIYLIKK
jgi:hypothetical protein